MLREIINLGIKKSTVLTISYIVDYWFDIKYGLDTSSWVMLKDLVINSVNKDKGIRYQPTNILPLKKLFSELKIPAGRVLVDLGCGKGRVLLIASKFGFRTLRGVDFSDQLYKIAQKNCSTYKKKTGIKAEFHIFCSDVVDYAIKNDEDVFFMYNPFKEEVLLRVLNNIALSVMRNPRKIWIIYYYPAYANLIENHVMFVKVGAYNFWEREIAVYSNMK